MSKYTVLWFSGVQSFFCLLGVIIFMMSPQANRRKFIHLGLTLGLSLLTDLLGYTFVFVFSISANIVYSLFTIVETVLMLLLYRQFLNLRIPQSFVSFLLITFPIFSFIDLFFIQGLHGINSYAKGVAGLSFVIISLTFFYQILKEMPTQKIQALPMFWINNGVLVFNAGTFFIFIFTDYLVHVLKSDLVNPWTFHNFLGIMRYILIGIGLWQNRVIHKLA